MALTDRQREERRASIGASEVAAMLGLDPYKSEYELWLEKTGQVVAPEPDAEQRERLRIGELMEPVVKAIIEERTGERFVKPTGTYRRGIMHANVDLQLGKAARGYPVLEVKNTGWSEQYGDPDLGEMALPENVRVQVHSQIHLVECEYAIVGVMLAVRGQRVVTFRVPRDVELGKVLEGRAESWWDLHVVKGQPPALERQPYEVLARLKTVADKSVDVDPSLITRYAEAKARLDDADEAVMEAKKAIAVALGDAELGNSPAGKVYFKAQQREQFDTARLRGEMPDLAAQFTKTITTARSLRVYPKKGLIE